MRARAQVQPTADLGRRRRRLAAVTILVLGILAYLPVLQAGFVWDDDSYVTENPALQDLSGLGRIWFSPGATPQYYPLVFTSFWLERHLWGLHPLGYHLVNLLLHLASAFLVWRLLERLRAPGAWLAALLFALHPVQVESVAWVTERKNVLSVFFYLLAMGAWFRFWPPEETASPRDRAGAPARRRAWWRALVLFVCALLSKTVTATFPAAAVLLIWWKQGARAFRAVPVLLPFVFLGAMAGGVTAWMERVHVGAQGEGWSLSAAERILVAGRALWFYAAKLVWPLRQAFIYPRWEIDASQPAAWAWPAAAVAVVVLLWISRRRLGRGPLTAVLFFAGTLVPALGFFNVYPFRFSFVADHFQYLASLGILALGASGLALLHRRTRLRGWQMAVTGIVAAGIALLALLTYDRAQAFRGEKELWVDTLERNPGAWMAHLNYGTILSEEGRNEEALAHFEEAVRLKPDYEQGQNNLGIALERLGRLDEARLCYEAALAANPASIHARMNLANLHAAAGRREAAIDEYGEVLRRDPGVLAARLNLGALLAASGRIGEATPHFEAVVRSDPGNLRAWINLATALADGGRLEESAAAYARASALAPRVPAIHARRAAVLARLGRSDEAAAAWRMVLQLDPGNEAARAALDSLAAP